LRRAAFARALAAGEILALAHHRDDQAETILLKLLRGAGPEGLGGMRAFRQFANGSVWRPLLAQPHSALAEYAQRHALRWIEDPSNTDTHLRRNFLRAEILPRLTQRWPDASAALAHSAAWARNAADLIRIVAAEQGIDPGLVEKDYWIMHCLYGLRQLGLTFELKGGTSLSKGFQIINRFSEDIDIRIEPPAEMDVKNGKNQTRPAHIKSRADFYDWLTKTIKIDGITSVERDTAVDNKDLTSAGIRLTYKTLMTPVNGLREGVLLEAGFAKVTPNEPKDISSWAYDCAADKVETIDNRAKAVACYDPGYTLVEKLQTISTKYRRQQERGDMPVDFMRHYYDVYSLLRQPSVQAFVGTPPYRQHKDDHFPQADNKNIRENAAFQLPDKKRVSSTSAPMRRAARFTIKASRASRKFLQRWISGKTASKQPGRARSGTPCRCVLTHVSQHCLLSPTHSLILGPFRRDVCALSHLRSVQ